MKMKSIILIALCTLFIHANAQKAIHPSPANLLYFEYNNKLVMLLGGSDEDNLFQHPELEMQLDLLQSCGGNYVRNTMSSRDEGNVWPFAKNDAGLYDLRNWNDEYWKRFDNFLKMTSERDIIVQIEVWATFDFYRDNWDVNPFNPKNNVNYDYKRSKLDTLVSTHPIFTENNFFRTVPSQMAISTVLEHQARYVDKLLSYSLYYDNVLYCMDNETSVSADWAMFWADYIKKTAFLHDKKVYCTEMWDPHDLSHPFHATTFDNEQLFDFVDISQNNHITGEAHWTNGLKQFERLQKMGKLRPVTNIKVYGNDGGKHKTTRDAIESFMKNAMMGCASTRFHRPTSGQGINTTAQNVIKSFRRAEGQTDFFNAKPHNDLLSEREENEAYCRANPSKDYIVYFTDGGEVNLNVEGYNGDKIIWINVVDFKVSDEKVKKKGNLLTLTCPGNGHWIALLPQQ